MTFEIPPKAVERLAAMSGPKAAAVAAGIPWCDGHDCPREEQPDGAFLCPRCVSAATAKAEPQPETLFGVTEDPQTGETKITLPSPDHNRIGYFMHPDQAPLPTSRRAAILLSPTSGTKRRQVLDAIGRAGARGLIDDEIEELMGMRHTTCSARRKELQVDGWIEPNGTYRKTTASHDAAVWILSAAGREQWRDSGET